MNAFTVCCTRGGRVESSSPVDVAVVDLHGGILAAAGDPFRATWWRSAAKPFQAAASVRAGATDHFGYGDDALALACASHSSEDEHIALARRMLAACGCTEEDLACGGHPALSPVVHRQLLMKNQHPAPVHSNCSGKHACMLALARHLDAPVHGYESAEHPVTRCILQEIARATGLAPDDIPITGDGCRARTFWLPLVAMAQAWARFGSDDDTVFPRVRRAMVAHPFLVAGTGRACTVFMGAAAGKLVVKVGAEGVYCATLPDRGIGIALKVHCGDSRFTAVALAGVLAQLDEKMGLMLPHGAWSGIAGPSIVDTRGHAVGACVADGRLQFR